MKIRPVGDDLFHTDGRTRGQKRRVAFRNLRTHLKITYVISAEEASSKYEY
jgi:hypothetical protein